MTIHFSRKHGYEITKVHLTEEKTSERMLERILLIKPDYPVYYLNSWFKNSYKWKNGLQDKGAGPGTEYMLGYLDAAKELEIDINLVINATKKWRTNKKREVAINDWLLKNIKN